MRPGTSFDFEWSTLRKAYGQKALNMEIIQTDGYYNVFPYNIQEVTYNYLGTQMLPKSSAMSNMQAYKARGCKRRKDISEI